MAGLPSSTHSDARRVACWRSGQGRLRSAGHFRWVGRPVKVGCVGASGLVCNKGGGPRIPICEKMKICRLFILRDLVVVSCSERLRQRNPLGVLCLEFVGSGIRSGAPMFFI
jgi:hypothetical protein